MPQALGKHLLVELHGCPSDLLNDVTALETHLIDAAHQAGATVINTTFHHFSPYGVSGVVVIQESHLAIHTWPEQGFAAIDLFTCGEQTKPGLAFVHLKRSLKSTHGEVRQLERGQIDQSIEANQASLSPQKPDHNLWFTERSDNIALSLRHAGLIYQTQSPFQKIEILDTYGYGRMLVLDGRVMCTERDECVYHEMIAHVPALLHPDARHVLIIGGGDGGAARELCRHDSIQKITIVELDEQVVTTTRQHLPTLAKGFADPRVCLEIRDGVHYIDQAESEAFDLILIDAQGTDELFSEDFYRAVHRVLTPSGLMVSQVPPPIMFDPTFTQTIKAQKAIFGTDSIHPYLAFIPTYATGMLCFSLATRSNIHPVHNLDLNRAVQFSSQQPLQYYSPEIHTASFALPPFVMSGETP